MEPADDRAEFFYKPYRLHLCLRRRGRTRLARNPATDVIQENNFPARRARVRRNMGAVALAAVVYRRSSQSVHAVLDAGDARHISLFLAGHNIRSLALPAAVHAFPRLDEFAAFVVCIEIELDIDSRHRHYNGRSGPSLARRHKKTKAHRRDRHEK